MKDWKAKHSPFSSFVSLYLIPRELWRVTAAEAMKLYPDLWNLVTFLGADISTIAMEGRIHHLCKYNNIKNCNISKQFKLIKVFRCSFRETIPIFFNRLNSYLISLSFTSDWLWNGVCQNAVSSIIDITMTTINKRSLKSIKAEVWVI